MIENRVKQAPSSWQSYFSQAVNFVTFLYIKGGVLPWFLVLAVLGFSLSSEYFLTQTNLSGISMHATYLVLVVLLFLNNPRMYMVLTHAFCIYYL